MVESADYLPDDTDALNAHSDEAGRGFRAKSAA